MEIRAAPGDGRSMSGRDDLDMVAAHVEEGRAHDLAVPDLPHLRVGHRDKVLRLDHVVGHPGAGHQVDVSLDAIGSGQYVHFRLVRIRYGRAPRSFPAQLPRTFDLNRHRYCSVTTITMAVQ